MTPKLTLIEPFPGVFAVKINGYHVSARLNKKDAVKAALLFYEYLDGKFINAETDQKVLELINELSQKLTSKKQ